MLYVVIIYLFHLIIVILLLCFYCMSGSTETSPHLIMNDNYLIIQNFHSSTHFFAEIQLWSWLSQSALNSPWCSLFYRSTVCEPLVQSHTTSVCVARSKWTPQQTGLISFTRCWTEIDQAHVRARWSSKFRPFHSTDPITALWVKTEKILGSPWRMARFLMRAFSTMLRLPEEGEERRVRRGETGQDRAGLELNSRRCTWQRKSNGGSH